jgi:AraC-like DNA-binding protein
MSHLRQRAIFDRRERGSAQATTLSYDYPSGYAVPEHFHAEDQLIYAQRGVMTVVTPEGMWVVPPERALWVPARVAHAITMSGRVMMKTVYLAPRLARALPRRCSVLHVTPLLRELVVHACALEKLRRAVPTQRRLLGVLLDQLEASPPVPLDLPRPRDPRALRVAEHLLENPGERRPLALLARGSGASKRTLERLFSSETNMSFGRWRQQLSLLFAIRLLAAGEKVTTVALEAGYATASAFISMFRRALGTTPGEYFEASSRSEPRTRRRRRAAGSRRGAAGGRRGAG